MIAATAPAPLGTALPVQFSASSKSRGPWAAPRQRPARTGVTVRKVAIPVAAGRNLAVLLEAAVRNYILLLRGIDSNAEFFARQRLAIESGT